MIKILFHARTYYPQPHSGADVYAGRLNVWLADHGCDVKVIVDSRNPPETYINHTVQTNQHMIAEQYEWCDVVITNLVTRNQACDLAKRFGKPIFHICHNKDIPSVEPGADNHIIYNSYALQKLRPLNFPSIVVQPVTWSKDWKQSTKGEYITLINLTPNKGAQMLLALAQAMPQYKFLGVRGRYGTQMSQPLPNLRYMPFTDNMQDIYNMTKILIVPSRMETWSLCAAEAQCCGIPVICSDLPGIRENLNESAWYANGTREYMDAIRNIEANDDYWSQAG